jgi:uncharacterized protein (TIGR03437 family)
VFFLAAALLFTPHYEVTLPNDEPTGASNLISDGKGNLYFSSTFADTSVRVTRLNPDGRVIYQISPQIPGARWPAAATGPFSPDAEGNLYAVSTATLNNGTNGILLSKIDPSGNVLYTFVLSGSFYTVAGIAVGPDGSVFLTGQTLIPRSFITNPGAFVPSNRAAPDQSNAYVVKVNPQGTLIVYSTLLNNAPQRVELAPFPSTSSLAITVDAQGNAYVTGTTEDSAFPVSGAPSARGCGCSIGQPGIFVMKLNGDGSNMSYSTFITPQPFGFDAAPPVLSIAVDSGLRATVTQAPEQSERGPYASDTPQVISLTTLDPTGTKVLNYDTVTFVAGGPIAVIPDGQGDLLITGYDAGSKLPLSPGAFTNGNNFAAIVRVADGSLVYATRLPNGSTTAGLQPTGILEGSIFPDGEGGFLVVGPTIGFYPHQSTQFTRFVPASAAKPTVLGVANAAGLQVSPGLAPGELVGIYGIGLGPSTAQLGQFDSGGHLPEDLGGTQVYFNGIRAPLLYAADRQVNAIVPFSIQGEATVSVRLLVTGVESNTVYLPEHDADAEVFKASDGGSFNSSYANSFAVNQDGTINSAQHPAKLGTAVALFVSGAGLLNPTPSDGQREGLGPKLVFPVSATAQFVESDGLCCENHAAQVLYAGSAPTLAAGMVQINLQLPSTASNTGETGLILNFGDSNSGYGAVGAIWTSASN